MLYFGSNGHVRQPASLVCGFTARVKYGTDPALLGPPNHVDIGHVNPTLCKWIARTEAVRPDVIWVHTTKTTTGLRRRVGSMVEVLNGTEPCARRSMDCHTMLIREADIPTAAIVGNHYRVQSEQYIIDVRRTRGDVNYGNGSNIMLCTQEDEAALQQGQERACTTREATLSDMRNLDRVYNTVEDRTLADRRSSRCESRRLPQVHAIPPRYTLYGSGCSAPVHAQHLPGGLCHCECTYIDVGLHNVPRLERWNDTSLFAGSEAVTRLLWDNVAERHPRVSTALGRCLRMRDRMCWYGFAADPAETQRLGAADAALMATGRRARIFVETLFAATTPEETVFIEKTSGRLRAWSPRGLDANTSESVAALKYAAHRTAAEEAGVAPKALTAVRAADFMLAVTNASGLVVLNLEIAGLELPLLSHLLTRGALCGRVDAVVLDWRAAGEAARRLARTFSGACGVATPPLP